MRAIPIIILIYSSVISMAQTNVTYLGVGQLDDILHETSGLQFHYNELSENFECWSHNDANNTSEIFSFNPNDLTNMTRTIDVGSNINKDWEDMTTDDLGNMYIGDFGSQAWTNKRVFKISDPNNFNGNPASVDEIRFTLPAGNYKDMEGMIHLNDHLYLFTKQVDLPLIDGTTYVFKIPDTPAAGGAQHTATLVSSFVTKIAGDTQAYYRVTAADLSPDEKSLVLLCQGRLWIFSCFAGDDIFGGHAEYVEFNGNTNQKEGITFINNHEVLISKEGQIGSPPVPRVYYLDIHPFLEDDCLDCNKLWNYDFSEGDYGWYKFNSSANGAVANFNIVNGKAVVDIINKGTSRWHVSLNQRGFVLENAKTYRAVFTIHADDDRDISMYLTNSNGSTNYNYQLLNITTQPTEYSYTFTMNDPTDFNARFTFSLGKQFNHKVYIDDVRLEEVNCACPTNRDFTFDLSNSLLYEASNLITANNTIINAANEIIYDAGQCVILSDGFEVKLGAIFEAKVDGCDGF